MKLQRHHSLSFLQFPHLSEFADIRHGIFTRQGGFSLPPYESLNVALGNGDNPDHVLKNRTAISACMGDSELVFARQIHGTAIIRHGGNGGPTSGTESGDGLISDVPGKTLVIQTADCQSVLIFDPANKAVANIHSGWRGSIRNIVGLAVQTMVKEFGSRPPDLLAGIGPSLGPCCAEFIHYRTEIPKVFWSYKNHSDCFDFWAMTRDQLIETGVPKQHIVSSNLCTRCRTDLFFSYRKENTTGRFAAVIGLV